MSIRSRIPSEGNATCSRAPCPRYRELQWSRVVAHDFWLSNFGGPETQKWPFGQYDLPPHSMLRGVRPRPGSMRQTDPSWRSPLPFEGDKSHFSRMKDEQLHVTFSGLGESWHCHPRYEPIPKGKAKLARPSLLYCGTRR
jgi:hypothetical protein